MTEGKGRWEIILLQVEMIPYSLFDGQASHPGQIQYLILLCGLLLTAFVSEEHCVYSACANSCVILHFCGVIFHSMPKGSKQKKFVILVNKQ